MGVSRSRNGQAISLDYAASLFLFIVAMVVAFNLFVNIFPDTAYDRTRRNSQVAGAVLMSDGNPQNWTAENVIRAGLLADDHLSIRKYTELAKLNRTTFRKVLRLDTEYAYLYITNSTGDTISVENVSCGIGDLTIPGTPYTRQLAVAQFDNIFPLNATNYNSVTAPAFLNTINTYDFIVLTASLENESVASELLNDTAVRTKTAVIIGTTGTNAFGEEAQVKTNISSVEIIQTDPVVNISNGTTLNVSTVHYLTSLPANAVVLGESDEGDPVLVKWLYGDTTVYYFGAMNSSSGALYTGLQTGIQSVTQPTYLHCPTPTVPTNAVHINEQERVTLLHDDPVTIRFLLWVLL